MQPPIRPELPQYQSWEFPEQLTVGDLVDGLQEVPRDAIAEIHVVNHEERYIFIYKQYLPSQEEKDRHNKEVLQYEKDLLLYQEFSLQRQLEDVRKKINANT